MNNDLVEVLERLLDRVAALDAAIASLSSPAEAQTCGCGEATCTVPWEPGCGLGKSEQHAEAQPAAVDGAMVDRAVAAYAAGPWMSFSHEESREAHRDRMRAALQEAIAQQPAAPTWIGIDWAEGQQPASDGGFTAADMMDARQEGRKEAQQTAAVSLTGVELAQGPDDIPRLLLDGREVATFPAGSWPEVCEAFDFGGYRKEQPAAVDGAICSLPALWRQREDNGEERTEFDKGYEQASDECADALESALAAQQQGGAK